MNSKKENVRENAKNFLIKRKKFYYFKNKLLASLRQLEIVEDKENDMKVLIKPEAIKQLTRPFSLDKEKISKDKNQKHGGLQKKQVVNLIQAESDSNKNCPGKCFTPIALRTRSKLQKRKEAAENLATASKIEIPAVMDKSYEIIQLESSCDDCSNESSNKEESNYNFDMLVEDDDSDEEGETNPAYPPPPAWSLSSQRGPTLLLQGHITQEVIDSFFSVQPSSVDLKIMFPTISKRLLKRRSSAVWQTPPRYSLLPKY